MYQYVFFLLSSMNFSVHSSLTDIPADAAFAWNIYKRGFQSQVHHTKHASQRLWADCKSMIEAKFDVFPNYSIVRAAYKVHEKKSFAIMKDNPLKTSKPSHFLNHLGGSNIYMGC